MKEFLSDKGASFIVKDIAGDDAARKELVEKYWRLATPTIIIDGKVFVGFRDNRAEIEALVSKSKRGAG